MAIAKLLALNANAVISTVIFETQNYSKLIKVFSDLQETLYAIHFTTSKTKLLNNISKLCCYNRVLPFL